MQQREITLIYKEVMHQMSLMHNLYLVMVLVDFVGHQLAKIVKEESRRSDVKIAFSKRSWIHMEKKIQECAKELTNVK